MFINKTFLSFALLGALAAPSFAQADSSYASERGEATYSGPLPANVTQRVSGQTPRSMGAASAAGVSREQVLQELQAFKRNPVTADGYRFIGGEIGYVFEGRKSAK